MDFGRPDDPYGLMVVAIPAQATRDLRVDRVEAMTRPSAHDRRQDMNRVMPLELELVAEFARIHASLGSLKELKVGDLIQLGRRRDALLRINDRPILTGEPGVQSGFHSVRVIKRIDTVTEEND